ncbi:MAG: hypothetical protein MJ250_07295 [Alphaproteobacteria bacterium]|nr:hypothetical protein [Alphaproteobacteria bacterium]
MTKTLAEQSLELHCTGRAGKMEIKVTKPLRDRKDLSLAYSPGVAAPCLEIEKNPSDAYRYTTKGNMVAVVSNGTAVLGLGDIGALASKPVMEGKAVLFKNFADVDAMDLEIDSHNPDEVISAVKLACTGFGGINLEDIKAPECFYIEQKLREIMPIPVFHDDQHGTACVVAAGLLNGLLLNGKKIEEIKVVVNGAGAAAIACTNLLVSFGVKNIIMCDSKGVIYTGRTAGMNEYKQKFAVETDKRTLQEAVVGADVFLGLSVAGALTGEMVKTMADKPIIFALANPNPEITPEEAYKACPDCIVATGRSDYPNQVNNVLGFPYIFRGTLDVRAKTINEEMKKAAAIALSELARIDGLNKENIIPDPFDPRLIEVVAPAVAKAAMESGVAQINITNWDEYKQSLKARLKR